MTARAAAFLFFALLALFAPAVAGAQTEEWEFLIAPYVWGAGLDGEIGVGPVTVAVDVGFDEILDTLDGGGLVHFEARRDRWTILADLVYLDLGQDLARLSGEADVEQAIVEVGAAYGLSDSFEILFGARWVDLDVRLDVAGPLGNVAASARGSQSWTDPFVGFRWSPALSERWWLRLRADVGGFDVGSDTSLNTAVTLHFDATDRITVAFGYRLLEIDYDDDGRRFVYDVQLSGAILGVGFRF